MIQLYYQNFYSSHPIAIPRKALDSLSRDIPPYLLSVMQYIGAHYHPNPAFKERYRGLAYSCLTNEASPTGFKVQAILLLAILDHASGYEDQASRTLRIAVELALELALNTTSFASEHSYLRALVEESWRRTYWELYVVSGLFAAITGQKYFTLRNQFSDLPLPCDEAVYETVNVSTLLISSF